jgi:chemotaxis protein MotA
MDKSSLLGVALALVAILLGLFLEGGSIAQIIQPTAAIIVFGGTFGAVMIQFPLRVVFAAVRRLGQVFVDRSKDPTVMIGEIVGYAQKARKAGIVSLDNDLEKVSDPFLKKSLMLAVDGPEPQEIRKMMEMELDNQSEHEDLLPRVFESAGGFAPTIGIIGAVLGLIQVMRHLDNISEVGRGIAVAFVATIYGVGSANLFFLPASGKIKIRILQEQVLREMMLEGVISILEGMNPRMLETKLPGFFAEANKAPEDLRTSR